MTSISLDTAIIVTERSKSTWRRRLAEGELVKIDADGKRTMLSLSDVRPLICIEMSEEDLDFLVAADAGDAEAQDDMGQMFLAAGKTEIAIHWLQLSARQDYPNAMQCLGQCYASGTGVPKDDNLAIMWIAKAAAHGHAIAMAQMQGLRPGAAP